MSTSGSSKTPLVMIHQSKIASANEGYHVVCVEFKQARYPFKWREYICSKCGAHRGEHCVGKAKAKADDTGIREEHLPPHKRLMLRYKREQKALAAAASTAREKGKEESQLELEEGEITWIPSTTITKGKRGLRRRRT
ncbi:hypothetical protein ACQ4PT_003022 [Festuca glaucescens]